MEDGKREKGRITSASLIEAHGIPTVQLMIDFDGGGQGFGGIALQTTELQDSFINDLCATFGVVLLEELENAPCYALRCWGHYNDRIEGLEALNGKRFVISKWQTKMGFPADRLNEKTESILITINANERRNAELRKQLEKLEEGYTEW